MGRSHEKKKEQHGMTRSVILKRGDFVIQEMCMANLETFLLFLFFFCILQVSVCVCTPRVPANDI